MSHAGALDKTLPRLGVIALALALCLLIVGLVGSTLDPFVALGSLLLKLAALWPAAVYLLAAYGLGRPLTPLWGREGDTHSLQLVVGLALLVTLSHLLGALGLLSPPTAIGLCVLGCALAAHQLLPILRNASAATPPRLAWILTAPAAALLLVAAMMPPGWLWRSEFGGYDVLSYHLQLPQEWLAVGALKPLAHNVYSYLPGYMEAAYLHLAHLTLAPPQGGGLVAGDGWRLLACQGLHAGVAIVAALLTARLARRIALRCGATAQAADLGALTAGALALATPWAVVTGSLAYNEAGVNALLAGALLASVQERLSHAARGLLVGLLVGVACGFKPTALFFAGAPAAVLLIAALERRPRAILFAVLAGTVAGTLALAPWLVRNALHGGNPVFPFASDLFGAAHWSPDQIERYTAAHSFDGSLTDRLRTLLWTSPTASPQDPSVVRFRGLANPQWGLLAPIAAATLAIALAAGGNVRRWALLLAAGLLLQLLAWLSLTHLQSRFLLPLLPVACALAGLSITHLRSRGSADTRAAVAALAGTLILAQTLFLFFIYTGERAGRPGLGLALFPEFFTGRAAKEPASTAAGWSHVRPPDSGLVYLVGDATPLYFAPGALYHTTYDPSPLGQLMREHPDDPSAWARALQDRGVGWLLISDSELARLQSSGWYDPIVTRESVRAFAEAMGGATRVWPDERRYLVRVQPLETGDAATGDRP